MIRLYDMKIIYDMYTFIYDLIVLVVKEIVFMQEIHVKESALRWITYSNVFKIYLMKYVIHISIYIYIILSVSGIIN